MSKPIDVGSVVVCLRDEGTFGVLKKGRVYKVEYVGLHGTGIAVQGIPGMFHRDRFELKYEFNETDPEPDDNGDYDADH